MSQQCSSWNSNLSIVEADITGFVPGWIALYVRLAQPPGKVYLAAKRRLQGYVMLWAAYTGHCLCSISFLQALGMCPRCTVAGPWGHQVWSFLVISPWPLRMI